MRSRTVHEHVPPALWPFGITGRMGVHTSHFCRKRAAARFFDRTNCNHLLTGTAGFLTRRSSYSLTADDGLRIMPSSVRTRSDSSGAGFRIHIHPPSPSETPSNGFAVPLYKTMNAEYRACPPFRRQVTNNKLWHDALPCETKSL